MSARAQPSSQPDRTVAAEGSDLEDRASAQNLRQHLQQLPLIGRDADGWQSCRDASLERRLQNRIARQQTFGEVLIDLSPLIFSRHRGGRSVVQMPRADKIAVNHPVVLTANSVQTKKKPPELPTTPPLEWTMIMAAPISPPRS